MTTHSSILAWEIPGQRSLVGYRPCGRKELGTTWQLNRQTNKSLCSMWDRASVPLNIMRNVSRHTSFYCASFYYALQTVVFFFFKLKKFSN